MSITYKNNHKGKGNNYDQNIQSRRQQLIIYLGQGYNLLEISKMLDCSYDTIMKDKRAIGKQGLKFFKSMGNKEISFYFAGILEDLNHAKKELWSIFYTHSKDTDDLVTQVSIKDKIQCVKGIKEIDTEQREMFKEALSLFKIEEQDIRLKRLESIQGLNHDGHKISFMNLDLPKLEKDSDKQKDN